MATTSPSTGRFIQVPDLIGFQAKDAVEALRVGGFTPVTYPHPVDNVSEAGFIVGTEPPPLSAIRPGSHVSLSVGSHPDFDWRANATVDTAQSTPTQLPLTWPHSADPGLAKPEPEFDPHAVEPAPTSAANPGVTSTPASPSDAAVREHPLDAGSSRVDTTTLGAAAESYADDLSASVPTPEDLDAWQRLRQSETASYADEQAARDDDTNAASVDDSEIPFANAEIVDVQAERAAQERARREARRRSARRYRRLTTKQKAVIGGLLGLVVLLVLSATSTHKHARGHATAATTTTTTPSRTKTRVKAHHPATDKTTTAAPKKRKTTVAPPAKHKAPVKRVVVIHTHTKVVTVTVTSPTQTPYSGSDSSYTPPASSYTPPSSTNTHTAVPTTTTAAQHSTSTTSKPASTHATADKSSSGSGGGSALQSPTGATAPPSPTQP
jgi:hypothetical protein